MAVIYKKKCRTCGIFTVTKNHYGYCDACVIKNQKAYARRND